MEEPSGGRFHSFRIQRTALLILENLEGSEIQHIQTMIAPFALSPGSEAVVKAPHKVTKNVVPKAGLSQEFKRSWGKIAENTCKVKLLEGATA